MDDQMESDAKVTPPPPTMDFASSFRNMARSCHEDDREVYCYNVVNTLLSKARFRAEIFGAYRAEMEIPSPNLMEGAARNLLGVYEAMKSLEMDHGFDVTLRVRRESGVDKFYIEISWMPRDEDRNDM